MLPIALNPYFDDILRRHLMLAARERGLRVEDLETSLRSEAEALQFLRECGNDRYLAYEEESSAAVDHVGWIVVAAQPASRVRTGGAPRA